MVTSSRVTKIRKYWFLTFEDQKYKNQKETEYYIHSLAYALQAMEMNSDRAAKTHYGSPNVYNNESKMNFEPSYQSNTAPPMDDDNENSFEKSNKLTRMVKIKILDNICNWTIKSVKERTSAFRATVKAILKYIKKL